MEMSNRNLPGKSRCLDNDIIKNLGGIGYDI